MQITRSGTGAKKRPTTYKKKTKSDTFGCWLAAASPPFPTFLPPFLPISARRCLLRCQCAKGSINGRCCSNSPNFRRHHSSIIFIHYKAAAAAATTNSVCICTIQATQPKSPQDHHHVYNGIKLPNQIHATDCCSPVSFLIPRHAKIHILVY